MSATEFKAKCLEAVEEVARTGEPIVVTKRGRPIAELKPVPAKKPRHTLKSFRAALKGMVKIQGDIISPIDVQWNADR